MSNTEPKHFKSEPKSDKIEIIKKCILMALLLAVLLFLFLERDYLRNETRMHLNSKDEECPTYEVSVLGDHIIEQPVVMRTDSIGTIRVLFMNPGKNAASGNVTLELLDSSGNSVAETEIDASLIRENQYTRFMLGGESELLNSNRIVSTNDKSGNKSATSVEKGKTYTFRITASDVSSNESLGIVLSDFSETGNDSLSVAVIDGKEQKDACLYLGMTERNYSKRTLALFIFLILATMVFVLLPFGKIDIWFAEKTGRENASFSTVITRLMFFAAPPASYFIIQKYDGFGLSDFLTQLTDVTSGKGFLNLLIIGFIWWLIYTVSNSVRFTSMLSVLLASAFGFTNYMLILFRDTPLVATDLAQIGTALQVADSYSITYNKPFLWAVLLTAVWCIACFAPPGHKGWEAKKRIIPVVILAVWAGVLYYTIFSSTYIENHKLRVSSFKPRGSYSQNGSALSFMISWRNSIVKKPDGYDTHEIEELARKYASDEAVPSDKVSAENPNVIIVMNESFTDLAVLGDFRTTEDELPFYRSLSDNTIKGWMHSSVFGGSTANSEFECLTGFSMRFLPFQSVPYRSIIKDKTPSMAEYMTSMGYGDNTAFHPGMSNSYNRDKVYPLLGFDNHIAYEDLGEEPEKVRDYVSDKYDYEFVEKEYENFRADNPDDPFWLFNVTIQNHGGYGIETGVVDAGVEMLTPECQQASAIQFLNLMKLSDEALEQLITYFSDVDEETVIVLFGDHQPRISGDFYSAMFAQHSGINELEWSDLKHQVPFMIWANYDINNEEKSSDAKDLHLSANYISPYLKSVTGMPMTGFDKYLMDLYKDLPVINAICYRDAEGSLHDPEESSSYDGRIAEYERIQYNGLIDYKGRVDSFFTLKQK